MFDFIKLKEDEPKKIYTMVQKIHSFNNIIELYKVKNKKTGEIFAAKIIKDYINIYSEKIKSLKKFESPYIVQFYHSYFLNNIIWVITEFVYCGSALDIMKITNKCYKEQEIASMIIMVLKALQYLHLQKKAHGAIKPSNILINNEGVVKLSDYNTSSLLINNKNSNSNSNNNFNTAPELLNKNNYSIKTDIWYLGLTCIELADGNLAFNSNSKEKNKSDIKNNNLWSLEFIDFVQKCLNENPVNRPSAASLINHPFIINNNKGKIIIKKKINSIKTLIDIYREKIDELEEKINLNENNIDNNNHLRKNSLEITSFNENLSLSQSDDKTNNISLNAKENKSLVDKKDSKDKDKKNKIKISIKNAQIQNNIKLNNNNIFKANWIIKKNRDSKKRSKNKTSLKNNKITSFEIYEKIKNHNKINDNIIHGFLRHSKNNNNKNIQKKRHSMINKYIKSENNKINKLRNDITINTKINNTQENIYPKNNLMKLLNKFNHEKIFQNKNVNKSQRLGKIENVFVLTESPNNKKIKHKYNYSIKITNNKNNVIKDKKNKDNKSLSSIDSLRNSKNEKNNKNNNESNENNGKANDKKIKSKTRNKKSNGGNQNLSELIESNRYGRKSSQKKNIMLRNLILNNSGKNIITEDNIKVKEIDNSKYNLNDKNNDYYFYKLNNSTNINHKNIPKKDGEEFNINNLNKNSKTPNIFYVKSGEIKRLKRPPLSHSSRKNNFSKKIKQTKKNNHKINITDINNTNTNNTNSIHNYTNISIKDEDKSDYIDIINKTNYTYMNNTNNRIDSQSFSYNTKDKTSLTEEELKLLCMNEKLNKRVLPELITELAGLENKMNQEIQKVKEQYEPMIKQHKEGIRFLKQNPFLKNIKEYENYKNFIKTMKISTNDDMENRSVSSSIHNLNKIKISFYQSNDIEELNISANKYIFEKTGCGHHSLMKI